MQPLTPAERARAVAERVRLTRTELAIVTLLIEHESIHGIPPTLDYLAERRGVTKVSVFETGKNLERKGVVTREKFKARSLRVVEVR